MLSLFFSFFFNVDYFSILFYLFLAVLHLRCFTGFSLAMVSRGYSLAVVHRLLVAMASLVEHGGVRHFRTWAQELCSWALEPRRSSCGAQA